MRRKQCIVRTANLYRSQSKTICNLNFLFSFFRCMFLSCAYVYFCAYVICIYECLLFSFYSYFRERIESHFERGNTIKSNILYGVSFYFLQSKLFIISFFRSFFFLLLRCKTFFIFGGFDCRMLLFDLYESCMQRIRRICSG